MGRYFIVFTSLYEIIAMHGISWYVRYIVLMFCLSVAKIIGMHDIPCMLMQLRSLMGVMQVSGCTVGATAGRPYKRSSGMLGLGGPWARTLQKIAYI